MKIGIDARFYGEAGPGRYVSQLIKNLEKIDSVNEYTIYLKKSNFESFNPQAKNFKKRLADYPWYSFSEQFFFLKDINRENFDLVHFTQINIPIFYFKPFVVTIHDIILHEFSTQRGSFLKKILYRLKKISYHLVFAKDIYLSKQIIVPSQITKKDLLKYYPFVNDKKIIVTYEAADHYPTAPKVFEKTEVLQKYGIRKPYLLCLGSFYPHKNVSRLVEALKIIKEKKEFDGQLVLIGKESYFSKKLQDFISQNKIDGVVFPALNHPNGYLSDEEVEVILANAFAYIQPALKEGFGLPPVEAMVFGVPTAVSNIDCLKEMCDEASIYFDPNDVKEMASVMVRVLNDNVLRDDLIKRGLENIKRFSWAKMAQETLEVYESSHCS